MIADNILFIGHKKREFNQGGTKREWLECSFIAPGSSDVITINAGAALEGIVREIPSLSKVRIIVHVGSKRAGGVYLDVRSIMVEA